MMARYAWVIEKEFISGWSPEDGDGPDDSKWLARADPIRGPKEASDGMFRMAEHRGARFRIYGNDGCVYYEGKCWVEDTGLCAEHFAPLDDFAKANDGATEIRYWQPSGAKWDWVTL